MVTWIPVSKFDWSKPMEEVLARDDQDYVIVGTLGKKKDGTVVCEMNNHIAYNYLEFITHFIYIKDLLKIPEDD